MSIAINGYSLALSLPPEERGELAYLLLESLPEDERPLKLDADYEAQLQRRIVDIDNGSAKVLSLEETMKRLRRE